MRLLRFFGCPGSLTSGFFQSGKMEDLPGLLRLARGPERPAWISGRGKEARFVAHAEEIA